MHVPSQITLTQKKKEKKKKINRAKHRYSARDIYLNIDNDEVAFLNL